MRYHRFFITTTLSDARELRVDDGALLHQWRKVFRFEKGDTVILFDGSGVDYEAVFTLLTTKEAVLLLSGVREETASLQKEVWLYLPLIKKDKFELVVEKATELGVSHIVPLITERTLVKNINRERIQKIIKEASEQSGRGSLPVLHAEARLVDVIQKPSFMLAAFHPKSEKFSGSGLVSMEKIGLIIGPEGGFSEEEVGLLKKNTVPLYGLGNQVLRAETAAIAVVSLALLQ